MSTSAKSVRLKPATRGASPQTVAIIGAGPAGLMAAEVIARAGHRVTLFDAMPTPGRKLLRAGIGGLNLTHAEELTGFVSRYGARQSEISRLLLQFGPEQLVQWSHGLGIDTFVGTSQRVFPVHKKAAPLLRAWLQRLNSLGVELNSRHRWTGWHGNTLQFVTPHAGEYRFQAAATVLALGGASWPQLGSTGTWASILKQQHIDLAPFQPSNCGFQVRWSDPLRNRFLRQPVKNLRGTVLDADGTCHRLGGELMITDYGLEGGLIYGLSAPIRDQLQRQGSATLMLDLSPDRSPEQLLARLQQAQGSRTLTKHLKDKAGIDGVKAGLLREFASAEDLLSPQRLATLIKALPVTLGPPAPIASAISTDGGVRFEALTDNLMLQQMPGVFCAGEMLDWEAPTGGYLLTACFASGWVAGQGVLQYLEQLPA